MSADRNNSSRNVQLRLGEKEEQLATNQELATLLTESLKLETPPVAVRFVTERPAGVRVFQGEVPSACTFWRRAEHETFYADTPSHFNCLVGAHTMGLDIPPAKGQELMELVGQMHANEYLDPAEVAHIPTVPGAKSGIVYGPVADTQEAPDVVLVWVAPYQAMLLQEATGGSVWSEHSGVPTFGRPSCAAIPAAIAQARATQSLGCMGMRVFTEVGRDQLLGVLPKLLLEKLSPELERVARANDKMTQHYRGQKAIHTREQGATASAGA